MPTCVFKFFYRSAIAVPLGVLYALNYQQKGIVMRAGIFLLNIYVTFKYIERYLGFRGIWSMVVSTVFSENFI